MDNLRRSTVLRLVKVLNAVLVTIPFGVCWYMAYAQNLAEPFFRKGNWLIIALFFVLYITYGRIYEAFRVSLSRISELIGSQLLALLISDGIIYAITWLLMKTFPPVLPLLGTFVVQLLLASLWCVTAHKWYFRTHKAKKTAVIYDMLEGLEQLISEYGLEAKFNVTSIAGITAALDNQLKILV